MFHATLLSTLSWVLWKILQQIAVKKHPFDNIPGPPPQSYLWGFVSDLALTDKLCSLADSPLQAISNRSLILTLGIFNKVLSTSMVV